MRVEVVVLYTVFWFLHHNSTGRISRTTTTDSATCNGYNNTTQRKENTSLISLNLTMLLPDLDGFQENVSTHFRPWRRSFQFWVRAVDIYTGYKALHLIYLLFFFNILGKEKELLMNAISSYVFRCFKSE